MVDVFLSYSREDRARIEPLTEALQQAGFSVWYDAALPSGTIFTEEIRRRLDAAACVLVVWTPRSAESRWVNAEALHGFKHDKLAACLLEPAEIGAPFNAVQYADLTAWRGDPADPAWRGLCDRVAALTGRPAAAPSAGASSSNAGASQAAGGAAQAKGARTPPIRQAQSAAPSLGALWVVDLMLLAAGAVMLLQVLEYFGPERLNAVSWYGLGEYLSRSTPIAILAFGVLGGVYGALRMAPDGPRRLGRRALAAGGGAVFAVGVFTAMFGAVG